MSEQYIVSALKYRPQTFNTVVGQQHITQTLKNALQNGKLAHSYLFCGPRGVGKTTCARILAKTINCLTPTADNEACDTCVNCEAFKNNTSFNIFELDAASNNSVDDIRDLVEQARFAPVGESKYKVYIIDEVHMLSNQAFNAFLKTLEEPPSYAIFILATTEKHKIIPTILSRCQTFEFKRITTKDTVLHLQEICEKEQMNAEVDALHFISLKSEGCMRDALSIMDKIASFSGGAITYQGTIDNLNVLDYDYFFKVIDALAYEDMNTALLLYDDILQKGFEGNMFLDGIAEHCRNLLMCKDAQVAQLIDVPDSVKKKYFVQCASISKNFILNALNIFNDANVSYHLARNRRLHVEIALIKLAHIAQAVKVLQEGNGTIVQKKLSNNKITPLHKQQSAVKEASLQIQNAAPVEQVKPMPTTNNTSTSNTPSAPAPAPAAKEGYGVSLLGAMSFKEKAIEQLGDKRKVEAIEITTENLAANWENYIMETVGGEEFFATGLRACEISFTENEIKLGTTNTLNNEYVGNNKMNIAKWFKATYQNDLLILSTYKSEKQEVVVHIKSQRERFEEYVTENPILKRFKDKLGLDFDSL
jgi:DNA polymerase III subunit gamma/tau